MAGESVPAAHTRVRRRLHSDGGVPLPSVADTTDVGGGNTPPVASGYIPLAMPEHVLSADTYQVAFDPSVPPALEIDPGDTVTFQTGSDAYERLAAGESVDVIGLPNFN